MKINEAQVTSIIETTIETPITTTLEPASKRDQTIETSGWIAVDNIQYVSTTTDSFENVTFSMEPMPKIQNLTAYENGEYNSTEEIPAESKVKKILD